MDELNLLPCPMCGGAPRTETTFCRDYDIQHVKCTQCGCSSAPISGKKSLFGIVASEVAAAWNRRAAPVAQLDAPEQPKSDFLNHLANAGKAVEGWPAWKTGLWNSDQAAQLDTDLPPLPKCVAYGIIGLTGLDPNDGHRQLSGVSVGKPGTWCKNSAVELHTAEQYRQGQREVAMQYVERIRHLEREHGLLQVVADQFKARIEAADTHIERLEAAERQKQPGQSINTPEFRALLGNCGFKLGRGVAEREIAEAALIAYVDGRTAAPAKVIDSFKMDSGHTVHREASGNGHEWVLRHADGSAVRGLDKYEHDFVESALRAGLACGRTAGTASEAWISVEDRMPENGANVVVIGPAFGDWSKGRYADFAHHVDGVFYDEDGNNMHPPSHWIDAAPSTQEGAK